MSKVLVAILSDTLDKKKLNSIYERFQKNGFMIEVFHDQNNELDLESLPFILNYLYEQERYAKGIDRISVLSNIKDLLLTWFRIYNDKVNDFILIPDFVEVANKWTGLRSNIVKRLSTFSGIDKEGITDKIYVDLDIGSYMDIFPLILRNNNFNFFTHIANFDYGDINLSKKTVKKIYKVDKYEININEHITSKAIYINTNVSHSAKVDINHDLLQSVGSEANFSFYFIHYILSNNIDVQQKHLILNHFFQAIISDAVKEELSKLLLSYYENENLSFQDKINYLSLMVKLNVNKKLLPKIFDVLKVDKKNIQYHYPILTNTLFYMTKDKQEVYSDLFQDRIKVMQKVNNYYKSRLKQFKINKNKTEIKKIAIITGQLLSINHSPTKWTIDYANNFKRYYPKLEIKIFVDDIFRYSPNEIFWLHSYVSGDSSSLMVEHRKYLHTDIPVYYSNSNLPRELRLQKDIEEVTNFKPDIIFKIGAPYSLVSDYLYGYYPIVSMTVGGAEDSPFVDIFTSGYTEKTIQTQYESQNIFDRKYIQHTIGFDFPEKVKSKNRDLYSIKEDDFVLITVGNRLEVEITEEFIDIVCSFLIQHDDVKWLIVGTSGIRYIDRKYKDLVTSGKIIFIQYEKDLFSLYKVCDVYVNPFRRGGGNSGAMAMNAGLAVVSLKQQNEPIDVSIYVGEENCVLKEDYKTELNKLYSNPSYLKEKKEIMRKRIENEFTFRKTVKELMEIFKVAIER